ncbi:kinase-like protein [Aspergillus steynii IBT 23096]|uniref:Kinase-like protein n=1 Tax=Aspergillus steynii IBT 23096 TaxID=1392250 RepID=A0A2I2G9Z3_9EURO|nr:kinase-like protein [Aspergillus steynii IBT 23096]PLB49701.1 kinase-like protein [Aspergillus steynii IBT 23096]
MGSSSPCTACSWTSERQENCRYESHVKLFYEAGNRGVWSLGSNMILKDRGPGAPTREVENARFVEENTSIPVPTVVQSWNEDATGRTFILLKRVPGEPLSAAWPKLSADQKDNIARQTAQYLQQLRSLQSNCLQALNGGPIYSNFLFPNRTSDVPHGPLASDEDLWLDMERSLQHIPEASRVRLRSRMPPATPYTFTHNDLINVNIMVDNGRLTGIIDWEWSGYFPVWCGEDREWKALLRKHMPDYSAAREFWRDYWYLCIDPSSEKALKFLKEAESEDM